MWQNPIESHGGQLHVFREHHYNIQPWAWTGHLTAVPRSTQPSTLCGMVKWVSAFGLSNNKWRWWMWLLAAYRRTHSPGRLAWFEGRRPLGAVPHSSCKLLQWLWATMTTAPQTLSLLLLLLLLVPSLTRKAGIESLTVKERRHYINLANAV